MSELEGGLQAMISGRTGSTGTPTLDRHERRSGRIRPLVIAVALVAAVVVLLPLLLVIGIPVLCLLWVPAAIIFRKSLLQQNIETLIGSFN